MVNCFSGEYRFLSNFWPARVIFDGLEYPTVENAYQAAKMLDSFDRKLFLSIPPETAKRLGKRLMIRPDWDSIKVNIMEDLVYKKFSIPELGERLLGTGDDELVEGNTWGDVFWGVCRGQGENHLGKILMAVRSKLRGQGCS